MVNGPEKYVMEYRGVNIYRTNHNGYYNARTVNGTVRADTLAGIKSLIRGNDNA